MNETIKIKLGDTWLDLPEDLSIQIETWNPLFEFDRIPGTLTFPFTLPFSPANNRVLGFPGHLAVARYRQPQLPCQLYLMGLLWKEGKLNLVKRSAKGYEVNFQTDVGDISTQIKEQSLRELDLGSEQLSLQESKVYPEANYALFPVQNKTLFEDKPEGIEWLANMHGIVNFYDGEFRTSAINQSLKEFPVTPFPYLVYVLRRVMANYGYSVTGAWLEEEETRRLVIYNTHVLYPQAEQDPLTPVIMKDHLPDMKVNEFLKAVRSLFCLGMVFNTTRKEMEVVSLRETVADRTYVDWSDSTSRAYDWEPSMANGFKLEMTPDPDDELQKSVTDLSFTVDAGKDPITCQVSTLSMVDVFGRLLPQAAQEADRFSFRLLSYRGMQSDQLDITYPFGSSHSTDSNGNQVGTDSLVWSGTTGLYERRHKEWLGFLAEAETIQTEQTFRISDLLGLDCKRRIFIRHETGTFTGLWEKLSFTVSRKKGLQAAKVPMRRIY